MIRRHVTIVAAVSACIASLVGCSSSANDATTSAPATTAVSTTTAAAEVTTTTAAVAVTSPTSTAATSSVASTSTSTSTSTAIASTTTAAPVVTGGYHEVGPEALVQFPADGITHSVGEPLADGTYYAETYELTADGSAIEFHLARFLSAEACIDSLDTVPGDTVDQSGCYGGTVDRSAVATIAVPSAGNVPVVVVTQDFRFLEVDTPEFARLLRGEAPSADAPAWFTYQPYWDALVEVAGGKVVRASQRPSS